MADPKRTSVIDRYHTRLQGKLMCARIDADNLESGIIDVERSLYYCKIKRRSDQEESTRSMCLWSEMRWKSKSGLYPKSALISNPLQIVRPFLHCYVRLSDVL